MQRVTEIVEKKVNEFRLVGGDRRAVKATLERTLNTLITEADRRLRQPKPDEGLLDRAKRNLKDEVRDAVVDVAELRAGVPQYADRILEEMDKPEARRDLNGFLKKLIANASRSTFAVVDEGQLRAVHADYACGDRASCEQEIQRRIDANRARAVTLAVATLVLAAGLFVAVLALPGPATRERLALLALCSAMLMCCGVLMPMIEVEARISELKFLLLGEPVTFTDQVLYFQSKSVLDVVRVLFETHKPDLMLVGVLMATFSVVFPLAKLASSFIHLYDLFGLGRSATVRFFIFKSSKWSMADVFVVAIFMAYVGFSGIIGSQLSNFAAAAGPDVRVLTTNGTSLQIGFFMFLAFCIAGLATSTAIEAAGGDHGAGVGGEAQPARGLRLAQRRQA